MLSRHAAVRTRTIHKLRAVEIDTIDDVVGDGDGHDFLAFRRDVDIVVDELAEIGEQIGDTETIGQLLFLRDDDIADIPRMGVVVQLPQAVLIMGLRNPQQGLAGTAPFRMSQIVVPTTDVARLKLKQLIVVRIVRLRLWVKMVLIE